MVEVDKGALGGFSRVLARGFVAIFVGQRYGCLLVMRVFMQGVPEGCVGVDVSM